MAGQHQMPQGYGQPQQVVYVQQPPKSGGGFMKGCIIIFVIMLVLGLVSVGAVVGFGIWGVGKMGEMFTAETKESTAVTDDFMSKVSQGDLKAAYALCEAESIKEDQFEAFFKAYEPVFKDNTGVTYKTEKIPFVNMELAGAPQMNNNEWWMRLLPAKVKSNDKASVSFILHKKPGGTYKIQWIAVTGVNPVGDDPAIDVGSTVVPESSSGSSFSMSN